MADDTQQTVFIVDDEEIILDSLALLMKSVALPVKTFSSAEAFIADYQPKQSGCLLLDIRMPGMSGVELQQYLIDNHIALPVIFMTGHGDVSMAVAAMKAGAIDFIQKPFDDNELLECVNQALAQDKKVQERANTVAVAKQSLNALTPREREVMEKMVSGKANKLIAHELGLSQRTVELHRAHIMQKTGSKSLAQLVKTALLAE